MIRICHVTSAHPSNDIRIFQKECTSLAQEKDFDVYLAAPGKSRKENNVTVVGVGENTKGRLYRMFGMSRKVYKAAVGLKADIYHLHDPELLLYAKKLKKRNSIVIFDSHENYPQQIAEKKYIPFGLRKIIAFLYKTYVLKRIDAVIIPCTTFGKNPFEGRCRRTILLDNYPILNEQRQYIKRTHLNIENHPKVCYTGALSVERGITNLVKACYKANVKLILAGSFSPAGYEDEIMQMKEAACVDYRGYCDYDGITEIYKESDIGAAILLKVGQYAVIENLPTKTYEYMQAGLPVIMSDTRYNKKLVKKENFAYLTNPDDIESIADKISYIVQNYGETVVKTELAYKLVRSKYNWQADFRKLLKLYRILLNR